LMAVRPLIAADVIPLCVRKYCTEVRTLSKEAQGSKWGKCTLRNGQTFVNGACQVHQLGCNWILKNSVRERLNRVEQYACRAQDDPQSEIG
jgi:hypothetical protein